MVEMDRPMIVGIASSSLYAVALSVMFVLNIGRIRYHIRARFALITYFSTIIYLGSGLATEAVVFFIRTKLKDYPLPHFGWSICWAAVNGAILAYSLCKYFVSDLKAHIAWNNLVLIKTVLTVIYISERASSPENILDPYLIFPLGCVFFGLNLVFAQTMLVNTRLFNVVERGGFEEKGTVTYYKEEEQNNLVAMQMERLDDEPSETPSNIEMGKNDVEMQVLQPRKRPFDDDEEEDSEEKSTES